MNKNSCIVAVLLWLLVLVRFAWPQTSQASAKAPANENEGILLEQLSWDEAERVLTPEQVVVIPLGAESKEHGPLGLDTTRSMVIDMVRSLAHYGPRRFYIINTGISTLRPLAQAADELGKDGILLRYLDFMKEDPVEKKVRQSGGTHADEIETSMMLYIAPEIVRMEKASRDLNQDQPGPLTRDPKGKGLYSPTGAWGDPTLATREKGRELVESNVTTILKDIEDLR